jgi:GH15 family glucan-1,4-alpha-glucosidase
VPGSAAYRPISDYALIGDSRSAALVSREGSIDWLCWPRFDSRSVFARLLDAERGGFFAIHPAGAFECTRRYLDATNVLETTFTTATGTVTLLDLMPAMTEEDKRRVLLPFRHLLRRVECVEGEVAMEAEYQPRPDYARKHPPLQQRGHDALSCVDGPEVWTLRADVPLQVTDRSTARGSFTVSRGEKRYFALAYETHAPAVYACLGEGADDQIARTIAFWKAWSSQLSYDGPYREQVLRSALVLKLLTYAPSGAIVAAPTTSLPEEIGGVRNWDYRYCWLRDASFTVRALYDCGFEQEGNAFVEWLIYATRLTQPRLQILYDVFGESRLPESTLDHLDGYCASRPVRIGNQAHDQFQLDVYGEVLGAIEEYTDRGQELYRDTQRVTSRLAGIIVERWQEPDNGIWEKRSDRRHHVHGKIMAWAALDAAERLVRKGHLRGDAAKWKEVKDEIKREVLDRGFNAKLGAFVSEYDGEELDASVLYASRVGFLDGDDPRLVSTIAAIRYQLGDDDLIYRYRAEKTDDGLPGGEGAFLPCSFWLVEALAIANRYDEAEALFRKLLGRANDVGLLSEEASPGGALLGNFPQALTHIGLLNAAHCLAKPVTPRGRKTEAEQRAGGGAAKPATPGR